MSTLRTALSNGLRLLLRSSKRQPDTYSMFQLLPEELLELIFKATGDNRKTLCALCLTCPQFTPMARRRLYRYMWLGIINNAIFYASDFATRARRQLYIQENLEFLDLMPWPGSGDSVPDDWATFLREADLRRLQLLRIQSGSRFAVDAFSILAERPDGILTQIREVLVYINSPHCCEPFGLALSRLSGLCVYRIVFQVEKENNESHDQAQTRLRAAWTPTKMRAVLPSQQQQQVQRIFIETRVEFEPSTLEVLLDQTRGRLSSFSERMTFIDRTVLPRIISNGISTLTRIHVFSDVLGDPQCMAAISRLHHQLQQLVLLPDTVFGYNLTFTDDIINLFTGLPWPQMHTFMLVDLRPRSNAEYSEFLRGLAATMPNIRYLGWTPKAGMDAVTPPPSLPLPIANGILQDDVMELLPLFLHLKICDLTIPDTTIEFTSGLIDLLAVKFVSRDPRYRLGRLVIRVRLNEKEVETINDIVKRHLPAGFQFHMIIY
ncbi:hypothetical protein GQ42DRAFT_155815 [Ramicandelaber brevisporus]|nr:hypothetical protein GQ42DRAFT_155815 [Ramicandelaber brevisporus]